MTSRRYRVCFYYHDDQQMDFPQSFECWAEDEDDADEKCAAFYPRCTTTHIEEIEEDACPE